jgi:hypothetical protein
LINVKSAHPSAQSPKFGGVFRSDIMFKGGEVWLSGYFEDNTAKMGSVANIFNLREGSRFVFKPDKVCDGHCLGGPPRNPPVSFFSFLGAVRKYTV